MRTRRQSEKGKITGRIVGILDAEVQLGGSTRMLVLTRGIDTAVHVGGDIAVVVRSLAPGQAAIEIDYPSALMLKTAAGSPAGSTVSAGVGNGMAPAGPARSMASVVLAVEETVWIGESISVKVVAFLPTGRFPHRVRLGFTAPRELRISRDDFLRKEGLSGPEGGS